MPQTLPIAFPVFTCFTLAESNNINNLVLISFRLARDARPTCPSRLN
jgi:hypothetical protein